MRCGAAPAMGDGEHDDTAALNAWFRGETVIWGQTHQPVGAEIADRAFLLSSIEERVLKGTSHPSASEKSADR
jgi:hypothetical protein